MKPEQTQTYRDNAELPVPRNATGEQVTLAVTSPSTDANAADSSLMLFFAIGLVVNIVLIVAYFWWAMGQWKKKRSRPTDR